MKRLATILLCVFMLYGVSVYGRAVFWTIQAEYFLEELVFKSAAPWDSDEIYRRSSSSLKANGYEHIVNRVVAASSLLGDAKEITSGAECRLIKGISSFYEKEMPYAYCDVEVKFDKQTIGMHFVLVSESRSWWIRYGDWQINDFSIN